MATLTPARASAAGAAVTAATPTATTGDSFANNGKQAIRIFNGSASPITVTIPRANASAGSGMDDPSGGSVPAGATRLFGQFPTAQYGDTVTFICSAVTDVTAEVLTIG